MEIEEQKLDAENNLNIEEQVNKARVYKPLDFIYFNQLGQGAFSKVRRCKIKLGTEGKLLTQNSNVNDE